MEIFIIIIFFFIALYLYFSWEELRKIRILSERPRSYKEKLDEGVKGFDKVIAEQKLSFIQVLTHSAFENEKQTKEELRNIKARIRMAQKYRKECYKEFYEQEYPHNLESEDYPNLGDNPKEK